MLITLHKASSESATMLDSCLKKLLSTMKRIIALTNNNLFAGFYMVMPNKCIFPIFQPQRFTLTNPNTGVKLEYLISHGRKDPRFLCAE